MWSPPWLLPASRAVGGPHGHVAARPRRPLAWAWPARPRFTLPLLISVLHEGYTPRLHGQAVAPNKFLIWGSGPETPPACPHEPPRHPPATTRPPPTPPTPRRPPPCSAAPRRRTPGPPPRPAVLRPPALQCAHLQLIRRVVVDRHGVRARHVLACTGMGEGTTLIDQEVKLQPGGRGGARQHIRCTRVLKRRARAWVGGWVVGGRMYGPELPHSRKVFPAGKVSCITCRRAALCACACARQLRATRRPPPRPRQS